MRGHPTPKPKQAYHHGDLSRALVDAAVRIVGEAGVEALTLRGVGQRVGVSRSAPYRHFKDKAALLAAVALEGFRLLRRDLEAALAAEGRTEPLIALSEAYVGFGINHPSHYRTMFEITWGDKNHYPALVQEGNATSRILVEAIIRGQAAGRLAPGVPGQIAWVVWTLVHGIVMLREDDPFSHGAKRGHEQPSRAAFAMTTLLRGLFNRENEKPVSPVTRSNGKALSTRKSPSRSTSD